MVDRINSLFGRVWLTAQGGFKREEGQAVAEYALILALVVIGAVTILGTLGTNITAKIGRIVTALGA